MAVDLENPKLKEASGFCFYPPPTWLTHQFKLTNFNYRVFCEAHLKKMKTQIH